MMTLRGCQSRKRMSDFIFITRKMKEVKDINKVFQKNNVLKKEMDIGEEATTLLVKLVTTSKSDSTTKDGLVPHHFPARLLLGLPKEPQLLEDFPFL